MSKGEKERKARVLVKDVGNVNKKNSSWREDTKMPRRKMTEEQKKLHLKDLQRQGKKVA